MRVVNDFNFDVVFFVNVDFMRYLKDGDVPAIGLASLSYKQITKTNQ